MDNTLDLEIRKNQVHIYYRGGRILKIEEGKSAFIPTYLDWGYLSAMNQTFLTVWPTLPRVLSNMAKSNKIRPALPMMKQAMDCYFTAKPSEEREYQQHIVRENNLSGVANGTDYFICDIEYAYPRQGFRFDMVAVHWTSTAAERKKTDDRRLAFIEVKYGDKALKGKSGIAAHVKSVRDFVKRKKLLNNVKKEMIALFNQKRDLGIITECKKDLGSFSEQPPECILILANHDPASRRLYDELGKLSDSDGIELKFAVSNFMGYGLYEQGIYGLDAFRKRFVEQIKE